MRHNALVGAALVLLAAVGVVVYGALAPAKRTFSTAIASDQPMGKVRPRGRICQGPIFVPPDAGFSSIGVRLSPSDDGSRRRSTVVVQIREGARRTVIAHGRLDARWPVHPAVARIRLDRPVPPGKSVTVCFEGAGQTPYFVWGSPARSPTPEAVNVIADRQIGGRLSISFYRDSGTRLSELPVVFERMTRFRPPWLGPWFAWSLVVALVGAAVAMAVAFRSAARQD